MLVFEERKHFAISQPTMKLIPLQQNWGEFPLSIHELLSDGTIQEIKSLLICERQSGVVFLVIKEVCEMSFIAIVKENTKYFWKLLQNERNKEIPLVLFNVLDVLEDFMNPGWRQGLE